MMRVRKSLAAGAAVCLMGLLGACGQEQNAAQIPEETDALSASAAPSVPDPIQLPLSPLTEEHAAARTAYVSALEQLLESHRLPDGSALGSGDVNQDLSGDAFAVCDVDQDGAEELIVLHTSDMMAGQAAYVFGWDPDAGQIRTQLQEFPALTFYESGAVQADWSHNQGKGGSFWPYTLYRYDEVQDLYVEVGSVDAWEKAQWPEDYPDQADSSGSGFVYYIHASRALDWEDPLDASVYQGWRYPYVRSGQTLEPDYRSLSQENIQLLLESWLAYSRC